MFTWRNHSLQPFQTATRVVLALLVAAQVSMACSWDYPIWQVRKKTADPIYRFVQNEKAGYIDRAGNVIIQPTLWTYGNNGYEFEDGLLHVGVTDATYLDTAGKFVINKDYSSAWDFSEGLAAAMPQKGTSWGYINRSGEFVISPRFATYPKGYVSSFSEGLAMIKVGKKYGYIDRTGNFVVQPKLLLGWDFHEGLARVVMEGPCAYYGDGPCPDYELLGESVRGRKVRACKFAFVDTTGSILTRERYDYAKDFSEGLAAVLVGKKWGYVDRKGRMTIQPAFDDAEAFSDGLARVRQGKLFGYVDRNGVLVIPPQFQRADAFSDGLAAVSNTWNEKEFRQEAFFFINKQGEQAIPEKFLLASHFFKGLAHVKLRSEKKSRHGTFAYIDTSGKRIFTYEGEGD